MIDVMWCIAADVEDIILLDHHILVGAQEFAIFRSNLSEGRVFLPGYVFFRVVDWGRTII